MKKLINGKLVNMTAEEIAEIQAEAAQAALLEKTRPFTEGEVIRMLITQQVNTFEVDDNTALRMKEFYPVWAENTGYIVDYKIQYNNKLYKCKQEHTSQVGWEPEAVASLWEVINETHSGAQEDPIPYDGNMALVNGLYYIQNGVIYRCTRDTVSPVYNALNDLKGIYVEEV